MRSDTARKPFASVLLAAFLLLCIAAPAAANPFMGGGIGANGAAARQAAPVRTSPANRDLVAHQADLRDALGNYLQEWTASGSPSLLRLILGVSFLYGILHAFGPGHRKTVIFSLYLARNAPPWEPAGTGILLSILHAGAAVVLLLLLRGVSGAISGKADTIALYMEGGAYAILIAAAFFLVIHALRDILRASPPKRGASASLCTILLTGIYPCPGAILILVLSLTLDITGIGILAVFAMSLGMSVPIIAAGYLAWFGRAGLFLAVKKHESMIGRLSAGIELIGYSFLLLFALYMAQPFILSVVRMITH